MLFSVSNTDIVPKAIFTCPARQVESGDVVAAAVGRIARHVCSPYRLDLSHDTLDFAFSLGRATALQEWKSPGGDPWIDRSSRLFTVASGVQVFDAHSASGKVRHAPVEHSLGDVRQAVIAMTCTGSDLEVDLHFLVYVGSALLEQWVVVRNAGAQPITIDRLDSFALHVPHGDYELLSFSSGWGSEFEGRRRKLDGAVLLQTHSGRSSNEMHPFFMLSRGDEMLSVSLAWSGNWAMRLQPDETGYALSGGLNDWEFGCELAPGGEIEAPHAIVVIARGDLNAIAQQYHRIGRQHWYPRNDISGRPPLEWNHWWSYRDRAIDEATFRANVQTASRLGFELCTLDAGWFGPDDKDASWTEYRGDWDRVNRARFPSGIRSVCDHAHDHGMLFGLWCEIEGLGPQAELGKSHPEFAATRDGNPLGYVCFGCLDVQEWGLRTLDRLVIEHGCDWIKLDFNVDPGAGCNRTDHGHGPGDGLYAHYRGYYAMLERFRSRHPAITLENCSSGGLRLDLGIMRQTHVTFLSDPDWPEHNLQVFWGATLMLAPEVCLHWGPSEWIAPHPHQTFDPHDPSLTQKCVDFHIRTALLGAAGVSLRLPELPPWVADRIAFHAHLYKERIRPFVCNGVLYRLTDQPRRDGSGDRWCAFQYSLAGEHLLFVFRLPGAEPDRTLLLRDLDPAGQYRLTIVDDDGERWSRGSDLMHEGISVDWLQQEDSTIITLTEEHSEE